MTINPDLPSRPSLCSHKEKDISENQTVCVKCGRVRIRTKNADFFYLCNGVCYITRWKTRRKK